MSQNKWLAGVAALLAFNLAPATHAQSIPIGTPDDVPIGVEEKVWGQWGDGRWYPGEVTAYSGRLYTVRFADGDVAQLPRRRVVRDSVKRGDYVLVRKGSGSERAFIFERHGDVLIATFPRSTQRKAITMRDLIAFEKPRDIAMPVTQSPRRVFANVCNTRSEAIHVAWAMETYNEGLLGEASSGWDALEPGECEIKDITTFWGAETRYPDGGIDLRNRGSAPTYYYAQNGAVFDRFGGGVVFSGTEEPLVWRGKPDEKAFCIMDKRNVSFRHVIDHGIGLLTKDHCKDGFSRKVRFRQIEFAPSTYKDGDAVNITF